MSSIGPRVKQAQENGFKATADRIRKNYIILVRGIVELQFNTKSSCTFVKNIEDWIVKKHSLKPQSHGSNALFVPAQDVQAFADILNAV